MQDFSKYNGDINGVDYFTKRLVSSKNATNNKFKQ
jgi:hypothetical protein